MIDPQLTDRALVARFAGDSRAALEALFSIEHAIDESLRPTLAHEVAHARLEWWEQELTRLAERAARHPSTRALSEACAARGHSAPDLLSRVTVARRDLAAFAFVDRDELNTHFENWSGSVFRTACLVLAPSPHRASAERLASRAGAALRELQLLSEFRAHAHAGRIYHPIAQSPETHRLWQRWPLAAQETQLLASALQSARNALHRGASSWAIEASTEELIAMAPALSWCVLALEGAEATAESLARREPRRLTPVRRLWRAWRTTVSARLGKLPQALATPPCDLPDCAPGSTT